MLKPSDTNPVDLDDGFAAGTRFDLWLVHGILTAGCSCLCIHSGHFP